MDEPDFFLASAESHLFERPRAGWRVKRLRSDTRDDLLLISVDPGVNGQSFGLGDQDICTLLVATRHKGDSLFPIREWPVFVHVARLLISNLEEKDEIHDDEFVSLAWAELYPTEAAARAKSM